MTPHTRLIVAALASTTLLGLGQPAFAGDTSKPGPAKVEKIDGSDVARVILTDAAMARLGIESAPVPRGGHATAQIVCRWHHCLYRRRQYQCRSGAGGVTDATATVPAPQARKTIPYSAVIYDLSGQSWAYVNTEPRTYVRQPITIDYSKGPLTVLKDGPAVGTSVVSVALPSCSVLKPGSNNLIKGPPITCREVDLS